jgi:hypothetical protein
MRITHTVSFVVLFTVVGLTIAGCRPQSYPVQAYPGPLSCEPSAADATHPCVACLKQNCCNEMKACDKVSFTPGTPARADAAKCFCMSMCHEGREHPLADCLSRCGGTPPAIYTAMSSCWETHCTEACEVQRNGGGS